MAASVKAQNNRRRQTDRRGYTNTYVDGNTIRWVEAEPKRRKRQVQQVRVDKERNREKALHISQTYVAFLAIVSIATVFMCVNYLQLQSAGTSYRNRIASLESQISELKLANDNAYENAMSSINMEEVKSIAINELGMKYADEGQIVTYNSQNGDYFRQYGEITGE